MYKLYDMADSGNCYKVRLLLHQLELAWERIPVDIRKGESRSEEFLSLNPNGKVPLLILPDGRPLSESNAMLCYLAANSPLLPSEAYQHALVLQWLFFEQYSHEPFIATNRYFHHIANSAAQNIEQIQRNEPKGYAALDVLERHLSTETFMVGNHYSIADIALYAYTHVADQGGYDLSRYPSVQAWLKRVAHQPRHITLSD